MGFAELFRSTVGTKARSLAHKVQDLRGPFAGALEYLAASAPAVKEKIMDTFWSVCDEGKTCPALSTDKELVKLTIPLTLEEKRAAARQLREQISCSKRRSQKWGPLSHKRFCECGGLKREPIIAQVEEICVINDCPPNRILCVNECGAKCCRRHGGEGCSKRIVNQELPARQCDACLAHAEDWAAPIRAAYNKLKRQAKAPIPPIEPEVLADVNSCWGCYKQASEQLRRLQCKDIASAEEWARAASLLYRGDLPCYPNPMQSLSIGGRDGGTHLMAGNQNGYKDGWNFLPPLRKACLEMVRKWQLQTVDGFEESMLYGKSLDQWKHRRMGLCTHPIDKACTPQVVRPLDKGDPAFFFWCLDSLKSSMEEFLDVFYDCASNFDGYLDTSMDTDGRFPVAITGKLGGLTIQITSPQVSTPVWAQERNSLPRVQRESVFGHPGMTMRAYANSLDKMGAHLFAEKTYNSMLPGIALAMAHPDRDEIEDQLDHLENKQGGEIISTPSFIKTLQDKRKEVRGKEFKDGAEGRLLRAKDLELDKKDIFLSHSLMENFRTSGIVRTFSKSSPKLTKVCVDLTNQLEIIKYPSKELQSTEEGILTAQTFTVLNRPQYDQLNRLAERGWKEAKSVCLNLHIRSYVPVHSNIYAFCVIMWGHSSDAEQASLCGAYCYLGDQEAHILELPLLCGYIGNSLQDFEAYKRSLVLSTCFYGARGISAGQNMFGITAMEFTEYLPTSYGGITHERDSWESMLRGHQGKEKGRFLAGFNVVDAIESGKGKTLVFPDFNLEPVPRTQPIIREFGQGGGQPPLQRSQSMRVKTFAQFRGANIPIGRHIDNRSEAIMNGRPSTSCEPVLSHGFNACADYSWENFICSNLITFPASAPVGKILSIIDVMTTVQATSSATYSRWLAQGFVDTDLLLVSHCPSNAFSGKAIWFIVDAYNKMPSTMTSTMNMNIARQFPCYVHVLNDAKTSMHRIDMGRIMGYTLYAAQASYASPRIYVVQGSAESLSYSANGCFSVDFYAIGERYVRGFVDKAILKYPISTDQLENLGPFYMPPQSISLGDSTPIILPFDWAKMLTVAELRVYSYFSAILNHFLGVGGKIKLRLQVVSSCFVTCKLRVAIWHKEPLPEDLCRIKYADIEGVSQEFALEIQDSFVCSSVFGSSNASIIVSPIGTPMAPQAVESKFEFLLAILGFEPNQTLCKQISYHNKFAWFMAKTKALPPADGTALDIPARCCDITHPDFEILTYTNPFMIMCATSGLHGGDVRLHISWTLNKNTRHSDLLGQVLITKGFGAVTELNRGQIVVYNSDENHAVVDMRFGTFTGYAPSRAATEVYLEWMRFAVWEKWDRLAAILLEIEVLPGFTFLGQTAGPLAS